MVGLGREDPQLRETGALQSEGCPAPISEMKHVSGRVSDSWAERGTQIHCVWGVVGNSHVRQLRGCNQTSESMAEIRSLVVSLF